MLASGETMTQPSTFVNPLRACPSIFLWHRLGILVAAFGLVLALFAQPMAGFLCFV